MGKRSFAYKRRLNIEEAIKDSGAENVKVEVKAVE